MDAPEKTQVTTRVYQVDRSQSYVPTTFYKEPTRKIKSLYINVYVK